MNLKKKNLRLAIVGVGYVGLPLALAFGKKRNVIVYDINKNRIIELKKNIDKNLEFNRHQIKSVKKLKFTHDTKDLASVNCFIITVPTPIDKFKKPDLQPLIRATKMIAKIIKFNDLIIYESTVYPGCIEEICVPIFENISNLKFNRDFFCGYSPERINPGDKKYIISKIKKITSGSTPQVAKLVDDLYNEIITAGTHKAPSIKVAEAAKVIENTQRDLNIALVNELSIIFGKLKIDTEDVLKAAESKWNFLPFRPGLVGGHCIGVDPYYLTHKAKQVGYRPEIILSGRKINDNMGNYVTLRLIREFKKKKIKIKGSKILIMGLTFKENCSDTRNSGVKSVVDGLKKYNCNLDLYDPLANVDDIKKLYGCRPISYLNNNTYDGILLTVAHKEFRRIGETKIINLCKKNHVIYDLKYLFSKEKITLRL